MSQSIYQLEWEQIKTLGETDLPLRKRPVIIVQLQDEPNLQKFNAIIVKIDNQKHVWVRYLDNPQVEGHYWWTGNKNNEPGLNPQVYCATFLGDNESSIEGLKPEDFVENGYDDIFNFKTDGHRFSKGSKEYPFLGGKYGNIHTNSYYDELQTSGYESYFLPTLNNSNVPNIPCEIYGNYENSPSLTRIPTFHKKQLGIFEILSRHSEEVYPRASDMSLAYSVNHERIQSCPLYLENCMSFMKEYSTLLSHELRTQRHKTNFICSRRIYEAEHDITKLLDDMASITDVGELLDAFGKKFNTQITLYDILHSKDKKYEIEYYEYGNLDATDIIIIYSFDGMYEEIINIH